MSKSPSTDDSGGSTPARHKCSTKYCRGRCHGRCSKCSKCKMRTWKLRDPIGYTMWMLKMNAKRRGHPFSLTREEFTEFCIQNNYIEEKGKTGKSASIDRISSEDGYNIWNIQVLTLSENAAKGRRTMYLPEAARLHAEHRAVEQERVQATSCSPEDY